MLRIRFFRKGRKKQPSYKIVVTDRNNPPATGRFIEDVGFYNPLTKECTINGEKVIYWMEKGAQPTDVVKNLLIKKGIIKGEKVNVVSISNKRKEKIEAKKAKDKEVEETKKEEAGKETMPGKGDDSDENQSGEVTKEAKKMVEVVKDEGTQKKPEVQEEKENEKADEEVEKEPKEETKKEEAIKEEDAKEEEKKDKEEMTQTKEKNEKADEEVEKEPKEETKKEEKEEKEERKEK